MDNKGSCSVTNTAKSGDCGPKKGCCEKIFQGTFVGGIVMFLYFTIAWSVLPWHTHSIMNFKNEPALSKALLAGAPESGVYVLPSLPKAATGKAVIEKPFAFVSVNLEGVDLGKSMHTGIGRELGLCLILAAFLSCLLTKQGCGCPVGFSIKVGLIAAFAHNVPNLIWWHFPANFTLASMADDVLAFGLAGLFISKLVLCSGKKTCPGCGCAPGQCKCGGGSCGTTKPAGSCGTKPPSCGG